MKAAIILLVFHAIFWQNVFTAKEYFKVPMPWEYAKMARYIMHNSNWTSVATISTQEGIEGYPFVGLKSLSDGTLGNGTGVPYMYVSPMDISVRDLLIDPKCTIMVTLAQGDYCNEKSYDPEDPRCAKLIITGKFVQVEKESNEYDIGLKALFERHPAMSTWPEDHGFFVAKIDIESIRILDFFGGMVNVAVEDYFNSTNADVDVINRNKVSVVMLSNN